MNKINSNKKILIWFLAIIVILGAIFGMTKLAANSRQNGDTTFTASAALALNVADNIKGNEASQIALIEYSDFQCPACGSYQPLLKKLTQDFGDRIKFAYRHFPLPQHKNAKLAATVAEAAGKQGKFWEMHDIIFENQQEWAEETNAGGFFIKYAQELNLDLEKFKNDLASEEIKNKIENDYNGGVKIKVNSTPSFFLNGKKIFNPSSYEEFESLIKQSLQQ